MDYSYSYQTDNPVIVIIWLLVSLGIAVGLGFVGRNIMLKKGRSGGGGFALGFFLGIIGLIICAVMSESPERQMERMRMMQQGFGRPPMPGGAPGYPPQPIPPAYPPAPPVAPQAKTCRSCGAALVPEASFCPNCGTRV